MCVCVLLASNWYLIGHSAFMLGYCGHDVKVETFIMFILQNGQLPFIVRALYIQTGDDYCVYTYTYTPKIDIRMKWCVMYLHYLLPHTEHTHMHLFGRMTIRQQLLCIEYTKSSQSLHKPHTIIIYKLRATYYEFYKQLLGVLRLKKINRLRKKYTHTMQTNSDKLMKRDRQP